jgi:hypothetical protein
MSDTQPDRPDPLDDGSDIDLDDPVNREHPLNRGRAAWWLAIPGRAAGPRLGDLAGFNHAALTNMDAASGWRSPTRPGGFGQLRFDGSDDYLDCGQGPFTTVGTGDFTAGFWGNLDSYSGFIGCFGCAAFTGSLWDGWMFETATGPARMTLQVGSAQAASPASIPLVAGSWYRFVGTREAGVATCYVNGVPGSPASASYSVAVARSLLIGKHNDATYPRYMPGSGDDYFYSSRAWPAAEVAADYELCLRGYPGVLNRL